MKEFIFGADSYRAHRYIRELTGGHFKTYDRTSDLQEVALQLDQLGLFGETQVVVLRNLLSELDAIADRLNNTPSSIILWEEKPKPDLRKKAIKELVSTFKTVEFHPLEPRAAISWVEDWTRSRSWSIQPEAARLLIEWHGANMALLENELTKLYWFMRERPTEALSVEEVRKVSNLSVESTIFGWLDGVAGRQMSLVKKETRLLKAQFIDEWYVLALLVKHVRHLLQLKLNVPCEAHPYVQGKLKRILSKWSQNSLETAYSALLQLEFRVKKGESELWPELMRWLWRYVPPNEI